MHSRKLITCLALSLSSLPLAAYSFGEPIHCLHPVFAFFGGAGGLNPGRSQTYTGTDDNQFIYKSPNQTSTVGLAGVFFGLERALPDPRFLIQSGIEYTQFGNVNIKGQHLDGIEPDTSTLYTYRYSFQTRQVMWVAKLLGTFHQIIHPYVSFGIGAAFNKYREFSAVTQETDSINLTPMFPSRQQTEFSYNAGIGVDTTVTEHLRLGLGYKFTDLGSASTGNGKITFNNFQTSVPFSLHKSNIYVNQVIAQATFLI